jgi:ribonuclease-3
MADRRAEAVSALTRNLGHDFRDAALLEQALTHASVGEGAERDARGRPFLDNQRLEFLGDRVLGLLVADRLMRDFPEANEGDMSSRLHALVDKAACARVADRLQVGPAMRLSPGEAKQGGRRREGVLGDAMEALLAAVWLDGGIDAARKVFDTAWQPEFAANPKKALTNPKSAPARVGAGAGTGASDLSNSGANGLGSRPDVHR